MWSVVWSLVFLVLFMLAIGLALYCAIAAAAWSLKALSDAWRHRGEHRDGS